MMVYLSEISDLEDSIMVRSFGKVTKLDLKNLNLYLTYKETTVVCNLRLIEQISGRVNTWYEFQGEKVGDCVVCRILLPIEEHDVQLLEAMYEIKKIYS
jgi:hypothetical protein